MGLRFRKSVKLMPGLRLNLSLAGLGLGIGGRGLNMSFGPGGRQLNVGVPGTGLSHSLRFGGTARHAAGGTSAFSALAGLSRETQALESELLQSLDRAREVRNMELVCVPGSDASLKFFSTDGTELSDEILAMVSRDRVRGAIETACRQIEDDIESIGRLHEGTSAPDTKPRYVAKSFDVPVPPEPEHLAPNLIDRLLGRAPRIEAQQRVARATYEAAHSKWTSAKAAHEQAEGQLQQLIEQSIYCDESAMMQFLEARLSEVPWPRETLVSFELRDDGHSAFLDVDLPELEQMPSRTATVPSRGARLSFKELSPTKRRKMYADHIHGVLFRIVGEVFAALPTVQMVVASGYSQRPQSHDGRIEDEYLLSVRVLRSEWQRIDFSRLAAVNPIDALSKFEVRRKMAKSGTFEAIEPFT